MLLSVSCKEETIRAFNELTPGEQEAIRQRRELKCLEDSKRDYEDFAALSNEKMVDMLRHQSWKYEYKKDNTVIETSYISVWNVTGSVAYFLLTLTEGGSTTNRFLKINTTTNSELIADLRVKKCAKTLTVSDGTTSASAKIEEAQGSDDSETYYKPIVTYTFDFNLPGYFGVRKLKREKKIYKESDDTLSKTEVYEYVMTGRTSPPNLSYPYTNYANRSYCTIKSNGGTPNTFNFPYELDCKTDSTIDPAQFDPATELVI